MEDSLYSEYGAHTSLSNARNLFLSNLVMDLLYLLHLECGVSERIMRHVHCISTLRNLIRLCREHEGRFDNSGRTMHLLRTQLAEVLQ